MEDLGEGKKNNSSNGISLNHKKEFTVNMDRP